MLNRMGSRRYVVPILIVILMAAMMGCMFYPMAHMQMKGLPFAVVSLDEGMTTPQGEVNAGDTLVDTLTASTCAGGCPAEARV